MLKQNYLENNPHGIQTIWNHDQLSQEAKLNLNEAKIKNPGNLELIDKKML